ncbi:hypothetical protein M426DRAFT_320638 [Hypoxylon sp. CI-4A]|nr:hypothetical protein M426DRAFT_320638 [Hypoxylon sp. CI-4A]
MSTKRKPPTKIAHPVVKQSVKKPLKTSINESETAVSVPNAAKGGEAPNDQIIEISSDPGSSEYELSDDEHDDAGNLTEVGNKIQSGSDAAQNHITPKKAHRLPGNNGDADVDMPSPNVPTDGESDQESAQPTFGELARAHDTIEVPAAVSTQVNTLAAPGRSLAPPSHSLGTVLTQALRSDDSDLLESCLHATDKATIQNTIQRLDSSLAGILLTKLATRMHRRPGRAGGLMTWVQWTLIAHGGAMATQPGLTKKLSELHRVLEERSRGLNSLLALKGKLDLLQAQLELRRGVQNRDDDDDEDDDDEAGVVYVEGEDSDAEVVNGAMDLDDDELPVTNGIVDDGSEDDEESSEGEEEDGELEGQEDLDENDVNHEDVESDEEDSEAEVAAPQRPAKRSRTKRI